MNFLILRGGSEASVKHRSHLKPLCYRREWHLTLWHLLFAGCVFFALVWTGLHKTSLKACFNLSVGMFWINQRAFFFSFIQEPIWQPERPMISEKPLTFLYVFLSRFYHHSNKKYNYTGPDFFGGILSAALLYRMTWNNEEAFFHD